MEIHQVVQRLVHDHMYEVHENVHRQHVDEESGVMHEQVHVVISMHDVMEQAQQVRVQQHVEHENGVRHEVQAVVI
jgi:hypothetical protein